MERFPGYTASATLEAVRHRAATASVEDPLRVIVSACLVGQPTGWDGEAYTSDTIRSLVGLPCVHARPFCPEALVLGTPRPLTTCHHGDGFDVVDGFARVLDQDGHDVTEALLRGARAMVDCARAHRAELALLLDISDSCGSNVIYRGPAEDGCYQPGPGVAAALLRRAGVPTLANTDAATLAQLHQLLNPDVSRPSDEVDRIDRPWFRENMPFIRRESTTDHAAVDEVIEGAFGSTDEVALVQALRQLPGSQHWVATVGDRVAGHIAYTPVSMPGVVALAPLSVAPHLQGRGIGTALVRTSLRSLRATGARGVLVLGDPSYYRRFGFAPARSIQSHWSGAGDAWMALELCGELPSGPVDYPAAFHALD